MKIKKIVFENVDMKKDHFCQGIWRYFQEEFVRFLQLLIENTRNEDGVLLDLYREIADTIIGVQLVPTKETRDFIKRMHSVFDTSFLTAVEDHLNDLLCDPHVFMFSGQRSTPFFQKLNGLMQGEIEKVETAVRTKRAKDDKRTVR